MQTDVFRLSMAHPGDLSALAGMITDGALRAAEIVAVIGKTEGNGGINDFTRGYFTQSLMALLSMHLQEPPDDLARRIPCVLSGGTEGVLSPHYVVFVRRQAESGTPGPALAIGTAFTPPVPAEEVGRTAQVTCVADAVRRAMADARLDTADDVVFVQLKCPAVTAAAAERARADGKTMASSDPHRMMALSRAAGAFGIAVALGELALDAVTDEALLSDFVIAPSRASVSSGIEVTAVEVIVLGHSLAFSGTLRIACRPMADALDIGAVKAVLADLGIAADPQVSAADAARIRAVFVKGEPDRRGRIRGHRHTMLDDTDVNAQRHIRGALGGLVAGVTGDPRIFVSGGAEHQGPDGGGLIAVIAEAAESI